MEVVRRCFKVNRAVVHALPHRLVSGGLLQELIGVMGTDKEAKNQYCGIHLSMSDSTMNGMTDDDAWRRPVFASWSEKKKTSVWGPKWL
jgi:hypothetical protein